MIILIETNAAKYFHLVTGDGTYGVIELVDGEYRAEYYGFPVNGHSIHDNEYWEQSPMYHVGYFDDLKDAVLNFLEELIYPTDYVEELIRKEGSVKIDDWLLEYKELPEDKVDDYIQSCLAKAPYLPWYKYAKESRLEAEFYEMHPDDETPDSNADECYDRAAYLHKLAEKMESLRATAGHIS